MKYLRRLVWYVAFRLLVITCLIGLMTIAFYFAMNASNVYTVVKDGMARRAQVVMMGEDEKELTKYFSQPCIEKDPVLKTLHDGTNPYTKYQINGLDHRLSMEWMWCWPWEDIANATVVERIPAIDGRIKSSFKEGTPKESWAVPRWQSGRYKVVLQRTNNQWRIKSMNFTAVGDK